MAIEPIGRQLARRSRVNTGEVHGVAAFGIGVPVLYWLVRNDD